MRVDTGLADLSDQLLIVTVVLYALALAAFAVELATVPRRPPEELPPIAGGSVDAFPDGWVPRADGPQAAAGSLADATRGGWAGRIALVLTGVGWLVHVASLVARGRSVGRVPWGNMYEFSSTVCMFAVAALLVVAWRAPEARRLGAPVMVLVVAYLGLAGTVLYADAAPLVPALNSYWLKIHVAAAAIASGAFMVGAAVTGLYLLAERRARAGSGGGALSVLPAPERLDRWAYGLHAFAFPVWTFAVIAGAIWAEAAWGRYWGWDPKETWAFVTWVVYAGYLHARATAGWSGRRAAGVALVGFVALLFCYYGVNLGLSGLHSYAGV